MGAWAAEFFYSEFFSLDFIHDGTAGTAPEEDKVAMTYEMERIVPYNTRNHKIRVHNGCIALEPSLLSPHTARIRQHSMTNELISHDRR
jgi:hypothetical protein